MNSVFISFVLKGMLATLIQLQASYPATAYMPIDPVTIQGYQSDVHMIYRQDMLGTGEPVTEDMNPYLAIKPNDPNGVVVPTSTIENPQVNSPITTIAPMYDVFKVFNQLKDEK